MGTAATTSIPAGRGQRRLKNYLLDPHFQLKYSGYMAGVALLISVCLGVVLWRTSQAVVDPEPARGSAGRAGRRAKPRGGRGEPQGQPRGPDEHREGPGLQRQPGAARGLQGRFRSARPALRGAAEDARSAGSGPQAAVGGHRVQAADHDRHAVRGARAAGAPDRRGRHRGHPPRRGPDPTRCAGRSATWARKAEPAGATSKGRRAGVVLRRVRDHGEEPAFTPGNRDRPARQRHLGLEARLPATISTGCAAYVPTCSGLSKRRREPRTPPPRTR